MLSDVFDLIPLLVHVFLLEIISGVIYIYIYIVSIDDYVNTFCAKQKDNMCAVRVFGLSRLGYNLTRNPGVSIPLLFIPGLLFDGVSFRKHTCILL